MSVRMMMQGRKPAGGGGAFDPIADVGWSHAYWAEGSEFTALGYADGGAVSSWPDEKATQDISQATATNQPAYRATGGPNSLPCVHADGNDWLQGSFPSALSQPYTIVIVAIGENSATADNRFFDGVSNSSVLDELSAGGYLLNAGSSVTGGTRDGNPHLFTSLFNGASSLVERDGTTIVSGNAGTNTLSGLTLFAARTGETRPSAHKIAFAGVYNGDVRNDAGWADFEAWTETHYGLTVA